MADTYTHRLGLFQKLQLKRVLLYDPCGGMLFNLNERLYGPVTDRIHRYVTEHAQPGNPDSVIQALDKFGREQQWIFCLGDEKGPIVKKIVEEVKPMTSLEVGTFIGYSAINAARILPEGARYICIEPEERHVDTARKIVNYAGLQDTIDIIPGYSNDVIPTLKEKGFESFDYVFIDHVKAMYKSDLLLLEKHGLLRRGTVIAADNVIIPGTPDYLEYVRNSPKYRSEYFESNFEYTSLPDGIEKSTYLE